MLLRGMDGKVAIGGQSGELTLKCKCILLYMTPNEKGQEPESLAGVWRSYDGARKAGNCGRPMTEWPRRVKFASTRPVAVLAARCFSPHLLSFFCCKYSVDFAVCLTTHKHYNGKRCKPKRRRATASGGGRSLQDSGG